MPRILLPLLAFVLWCYTAACPAAGPTGVLTLTNGDYYHGVWLGGGPPDLLRWQTDFVGEPFNFEWASVSYAILPPPKQPVPSRGALRFHLVAGDVLTGDLRDVSPEWFTVATALDANGPPQQLRIARSAVRSIVRVAADGAVNGGPHYIGPDELSAWEVSAEGDWEYALGGLTTTTPYASATRDMELPGKALIEVELSWKKQADFSLELGVTKRRPSTALEVFEVWIQGENGNPQKIQDAKPLNARPEDSADEPKVTDAFRIETVSNHLVVVRESGRLADLAPLHSLAAGAGRVQLRLYLDQPGNRLIVTTPTGDLLAELNVGGERVLFGSGLKLNNRAGDIQLDRLVVSPWNGAPPARGRGDQPQLKLESGETVLGEPVGFRASDRQLLVGAADSAAAADGADTRLPADGKSSINREDGPDDAADQTDADPAAAADQKAADLSGSDPLGGPLQPPPTAVHLDEIVSIAFPDAAREQVEGGKPAEGVVAVSLHDGQRVTGKLRGVEDQRLRIISDSLEEELVLPLASVRSVRSFGPPAGRRAASSKAPFPRLETDGARSTGTLTDGADQGGASCLLWRPEGSRNAAALLDNVSGRVLFREPPTEKPAAAPAPQQTQNRGVLGAIASVFSFKPAVKTTPDARQPAMMYLRVGDKVPCAIERIDGEGVHFSSPFSSTDFAAHEHIKAIELVTDGVDGRMTSGRRDQLLTLPRMQASNPPTHLLVSTKGDYLRCRLAALTKDHATVEVRMEETKLDRSRIARLIWLDPPADERGPPQAGHVGEGVQRDHPRVQAVRRDGVRLTFHLEGFAAGPEADGEDEPAGSLNRASLIGESEVLKACSVPVDSIDVLLLGDRIEQAAAELSYQRWKMQNAAEPRDASDTEAGDASTNFPLVGEPAPPLKLPFYAAGEAQPSKEFSIEAYQGEVLVLDFWASWCGPCMQVMPLVDKLGEEFAAQGVEVVAVNLQEGAEEIDAALDRLQISPRVALDRDGVAAQRYQVSGIPQTVVIGRDGRVANVFVGGGAQYEQRLRAAVEAALSAAEIEGDAGVDP